MTIDWWTLGLQAVNVLLLVWLLGHFFWKPVAAMVEQRRAATQKTLADATALQDQAKAALAEIESTRAGFMQERDAILAQAHADAELLRTTRLEAAMNEAATLVADAGLQARKDQAAAEGAWRGRASALAVDIAQKLCAPLAVPAVQAAFLARLVAMIQGLPAAERSAMAQADAALEAVSALPLLPGEQAQWRECLHHAIGGTPTIVFHSDPALIAGLELRGAHLVVGNSWRADLQRIALVLADEHA